MPELLDIGAVAKAHGLHGEVIVSLSTDRLDRLDPGSVLQTDRGPLTVVSARPHQHRWRVQFEGFATREQADTIHGLVLRAEPVEDPDAWFVHDLIGLPVALVDGTPLGTCTAIVANPAHDLVEVDGRILVPMPFVASVEGAIVVDPPDGLLDLYGDDA